MLKTFPVLLAVFTAGFCVMGMRSSAVADEVCSKCKGTGQVPCTKHEALNVGGLKVGEFDCADCLDLECCHGIGWIPCPKCKDAAAAERFKAAIQKKKEACTQILAQVEKEMLHADDLRFVKERKARKKPGDKKADPLVPRAFLNLLSCRNIVLATDMAARRVAMQPHDPLKPLDAHQVHHLYLARALDALHDVEDLHRQGAFDEKAKPSKDPVEVHALDGFHYALLIFSNEEAQRKLTAKVFENETAGPVTSSTLCSLWESTIMFGADKDLHHHVYNALATGMISQYADDPGRTQEERKKDEPLPAWLVQGFRHVLEIRRWGLCEEGGVQEVRKVDNKKGSEGWNPNDWPRSVSKLVGNGKARPFPEISRMLLDDMQCSDHQVAWSLVDFLLRRGMDRLAKFTPLLRKKGSDQAAAIKEAYELTQGQLESEWKAAVAHSK